MRAGAAKVEITPPPGLAMWGFGSRTEPARGAHDPLYARALLCEAGEAVALLLVADLLYVPEFIQEAATQLITQAVPISRAQIQFAATHTHGGPALVEGGAYEAELIERIALVAKLAWLGRQEAQVAVGAAPISGIGKNRRHPDGPVDHAVTLLRVDGTGGSPIATLINYGCHPTTLGPDNLLYTADFPGILCAQLEAQLSGVALFTTGAQGDVNPGGYSAEGSMIGQVVPWRNYESAERYGRLLAQLALDLRAALRPEPSERVWGRSEVIELPRKLLPARESALAELALAEQHLRQVAAAGTEAELLQAKLQAAYARLLVDQTAQPDLGAPVGVRLSALALGPLTHVGISGELFAELGLQIKRALGAESTMVAAICDGWLGYIPTLQAYAEGGYEPFASPLQPGAGEALTRAAIALAMGR